MGINQYDYFPATVNDKDVITDIRDSNEEHEIDSLGIDARDQFTGLANFANEATVTTSINKGVSGGLSIIPDDEYQDVKRFFERPRLISSVNPQTTRSNVISYGVANPIIDFWPTVAVNRLNGVFGYKCDIKFTVTLAATPFQQGLVASCWQYSTDAADGVNISRHLFPALVTNLPHVRMNFADATMCELVIPYMSPYDFFELGNSSGAGGDSVGAIYSYGIWSLNQVLPYVTLAGSTAPTMRIYVSLHNMQLFGAIPVAASAVVPQSGVTKHMDKQSHALSSTLSTVSKVSNTAGKVATFLGVPSVAVAGRSVGWLAEKLAKTAKSFGYSKPVDEREVPRMFPYEYTHEHHVDQPATDFVVSPYQSNRLAVDKFQSATEIDEMALSFVLGKYAQCFAGTMTTSDTGGTRLYATNLCPTSMWFRTNTGRPGGNIAMPVASTLTTNCFMPTALCYIGQMFKYWRGGLKFKFTFAKTKFHAGRVLAAFVPSTYDVNIPDVLSNNVPTPEVASNLVQPFQYSVVFDLRDSDSFEFEVPYVSSRPWLSTLGSVGGVTLSVIDPLITTGETSTSISYLVEVAAAEDFELGCFVGSGITPATGPNPPALAVYQSGLSDDTTEISQYTMGEKFSSLKELLMIPYNTASNVASNTSISLTIPNWWYCPLFGFATPMASTTAAVASCATQNLIARMFTFGAGGTSVHFWTTAPGEHYAQLQITSFDGNVTPVAGFSDPRYRTSNAKARVICSARNSALHAKVPSFQRVVHMPLNKGYTTSNWLFNNVRQTPNNFQSNQAVLSFFNNSGRSHSVVYAYGGSDDARAYGYIGPPPCLLLASTQSVSLDVSVSSWV